ncbi:NAD-dependent epimerase/dehydratase family protein [Martelella alba]|uniref:NAD(P)-dependent oxidoreductase n=1 Tax=Martelella alba TaxID=2590451 RepID=A0ABY2SFH9_9HYPH|nr:NAD(P)-dependent oxidoreductase [Martelella alba]TKI03736.1 NAD(P)-dependent oxidoreductase [Martelella alba]
MKTILITGAAGGIGTRLRPYLRDRYRLRLFDRVGCKDIQKNEEQVIGDIADREDVLNACENIAGIIHLACAYSLHITFEDTLQANYRGMIYLLDACRHYNIPRFVYASSHHVVGHHPASGFYDDHASVAPDGFYALSKVFGESALALYVHKIGLKGLSIRIGSAVDKVMDGRRLHIWLSAADMAQLTLIGLEHPDARGDIVYGISACPGAFFPNDRARELGYTPQDNAQANLAVDFIPLDEMPDEEGPAWVGGPYIPFPPEIGEQR